MRIVDWIDDKGYKRRSLVRDKDPDSSARFGIPQGPPSLDELDWKAIKRDLHNQLMDRGLHTYQDVTKQQNGVTGSVLAAVRKPLILLYRKRRD